jgi:hypothetical protein
LANWTFDDRSGHYEPLPMLRPEISPKDGSNDRILHKALASAAMTREEIEKRMDELAREFAKTHDPKIAEKFFELARRLREIKH